MNTFQQQFKAKADQITLSASERAIGRDRVATYVAHHPVRRQSLITTAGTPVVSPYTAAVPLGRLGSRSPLFPGLFRFGGVMVATVLLALPFVAERAAPGDTLYAVKVHFNEDVRSSLTWDPYEKVEWETTLLNRRIAEVQLLQAEGRLTTEAEAEAAAAIEQHAQNAQAEIETLRVDNADEAAIATIELDATLALQAQTLDAQAASSTASSTGLLSQTLGLSRETASSTASTSLPALPKLTARVEEHTTRMRELAQSLSSQVATEDMADVTRRIADLERLTARALGLPAASSTDAQLMLIDSIARAQTLIVYMTELPVREAVAIEAVVPIMPTDAELLTDRLAILQELDARLDELIAQQSAGASTTAATIPAAEADVAQQLITQAVAARGGLASTTDHVVYMEDAAAAIDWLAQAAALLAPEMSGGLDAATTTDAVRGSAGTASSSATSTVATPAEVAAEPALTASTTPIMPVDELEERLPGEGFVETVLDETL